MSLERLSTQALAADVDEVLVTSLHLPSRRDRRENLVRVFGASGLDGAALLRLGADAAAAKVVTDAEMGAAGAAGGRNARLPAARALVAALRQLLKPQPAAEAAVAGADADSSDEDCGIAAAPDVAENSEALAAAMAPFILGYVQPLRPDAADKAESEEECMDPASEITPYLCLGSKIAAQNLGHLRSLGVTHVLNVADNVECFFPEELKYLHCPIVDGGHDERIVDVFEEAAAFVREASEKGGRVFVHCYAGINRSATVAIAVLMQMEGWTLKRAHDHIHWYRFISPFEGNCAKIANWELCTRGNCSMEGWLEEDMKIWTDDRGRLRYEDR